MKTRDINCRLNNLQRILWPIEKKELGVFLPMALMMFCFLSNFGLLRSLKDSLIIPTLGAEVISFLKLWFVMPCAVLVTIAYMKLSNSMNIKYIYYTFILLFSIVFLVFGYVLYPNQNLFHPDEESINLYIENYNNFKWIIKLLGKWGYVLIYIFSDLWSSVVINLIFWQFVNNTTDKDVAKRFYPTLGMIGNLGSVFAGLLLIFFTSDAFLDDDFVLSFFSPKNRCTSETFIKITLSTVVVINFFSVLLFNFVYKKLQAVDSENKKILNQKTKLSISESIKLIFSSKYILNICVMVICYSFAINILEGPWKNSIKIIYPKLKDYAGFMGKFNVFLGFASIFFVFLGNFIFQFLNWSYAIFFSPILIGISGLLFFIFISFGPDLYFVNYVFIAAIIGSIQNIISKSSKYTIFDSSKEMAYLPLSSELRSKGKATVEILGSKLGKSMGALTQSMIFLFFPDIGFESISKNLMYVFVLVLLIWIIVVYKINFEYKELSKQA